MLGAGDARRGEQGHALRGFCLQAGRRLARTSSAEQLGRRSASSPGIRQCRHGKRGHGPPTGPSESEAELPARELPSSSRMQPPVPRQSWSASWAEGCWVLLRPLSEPTATTVGARCARQDNLYERLPGSSAGAPDSSRSAASSRAWPRWRWPPRSVTRLASHPRSPTCRRRSTS